MSSPKIVAGFLIEPFVNRFRLRDTCTINNWGLLNRIFETEGAAEDHAWRCLNFKEGRRMSVD